MILKGMLHREDENRHTHESMGIIKSQEKSRQTIISIKLVMHTHKPLHNKNN
jgi:hypothetical protein